MPISTPTLEGLALANLTIATDIQAAAIPHALAGRDILGAAKTGSGKTLAFVVPLVEKLYIERWAPGDGLAAVIITPTRELALQIFEVLRIVGKKHSFSAGLITGGRKDFEGEQERIVGMNILIATPGRFLQHLEQTVGFDATQVMVLVLDEADRILDMGFKAQLDSIVGYLPRSRQTMLFSATQTKSVKDLARLSLNNPEYLAVHAEDAEVTPKQLIQNYIVCKLPEKLDVLFSFIKTHLKSKMVVFFSTCSQVRFVYECFRAMQPGIPLSCLHGKIKQDRRTMIYVDFTRKKAACMLSTDIAARGLDFPNVDWVVQADAPEDAAMYVHRVGRTARNNAAGRALLMLMPSEEAGVMKNLTDAHVPIKKLTVNPNKRFTVAVKAAALLAAQPELKTMAKKAFTGYLRSLQLLPGGRAIVDPSGTLPVEEYATALGLAFAPEVKTIAAAKLGDADAAREENREQKNVNRQLDKLKKQIKEAKEAKRLAREALKLAKSGAKPEEAKLTTAKAANDEDDLFTVKAVHSWNPENQELGEGVIGDEYAGLSKGQIKKLKAMKLNRDGELKIAQQTAKKVVFDEEGNAIDKTVKLVKQSGDKTATEVAIIDTAKIAEHAKRVKERLDASRAEDLKRERDRVREKRLQFKIAVGNNRQGGQGDDDDAGEGYAVLGNAQSESDASGSENSDSDDYSSDNDSGSDSGSEDERMLVKNRKATPAKPKNSKKNASDSDDSDQDSDDSGDDSDSEESTGYRAKDKAPTKRKRAAEVPASHSKKSKRAASESDDDDSGAESEDYDANDIEENEKMVLAMLNKR